MTFRAAREEDAGPVQTLIYSSAPEAFSYTFGTAEKAPLDWLVFCFKHGGGFYGFRNHLVAELDGKVVGVAALYSGVEFKTLKKECIHLIFEYFGFLKGIAVIFRALRISRMMPPPGKDTDYVANLGVAPDYRGLGIGSRLLGYAENLARKRNKNTFALDVAATNHKARRLYKRLGFREVQEFQYAFKGRGIEVPSFIRLQIKLIPSATLV